ncbi:hypothetical protein AAG906_003320 [Vitis piasezkii]
MLSFLYAFFRYHQIPMYPPDEEKIAFITPHGLYYYKVMSLGLKNVGATYQRLMTKIFKPLIGRIVEVYIDDIIVKRRTKGEHDQYLEEVFHLLREYDIKLNQSNCAFGEDLHKGLSTTSPKQCSMQNPVLKDGADSFGLEKRVETLPYFRAHQIIAICFGFPVSKNEAEYEAILSGLNLALALSASKIEIYSDSQLIVGHIQGENEAKDGRMTQYLTKVRGALNQLNEWAIKRIPRIENVQADALVGEATTLPVKEAILLPVHLQTVSSIVVIPVCNTREVGAEWAHEIENYFWTSDLYEENKHAHRV